MKLHIPAKYLEEIAYPSETEVMDFTEIYRTEFMDPIDPDKGWHKFYFSRVVEVLTIGGINNYFLIYAYPQAGVEIAKPEDVLKYELWRGWILEYLPAEGYYRVDTTTYTQGVEEFIRRKTELGY